MNEQEYDGEHEGKQREREHAVGPAAPPLEVGGGTGEICEGINVREIGANDERGGAECRLFARPLRASAAPTNV
jgi:hypothetical protein